jgi:hypothetical protein
VDLRAMKVAFRAQPWPRTRVQFEHTTRVPVASGLGWKQRAVEGDLEYLIGAGGIRQLWAWS